MPSPSRGEVVQAPRALLDPRRSSAASGGGAATPGSPEKFTIISAAHSTFANTCLIGGKKSRVEGGVCVSGIRF